MVNAVVTDVVRPAVTADNPDGFLDEAVLARFDPVEEVEGDAVGVFFLGGEQFHNLGCRRFGELAIVLAVHPFGHRLFHCGRDGVKADDVGHKVVEHVAARLISEVHTETELRVVLEERVCPRGTLALVVLGVGAGGRAAAVDGGAARCVGDNHPVAEELCDELDVRSFAAACARAGELEERLLELAVLDGSDLVRGDGCGGFFERRRVIPVGGVLFDGFRDGNHTERLFLGGADVDAVVAAGAVIGADLHTELVTLEADCGLGDESLGLVGKLFRGGESGTDCRVRADERAAVALDAVVHNPFGDADRYAAFLELGRAGGNDAVGRECGDGQFVAFLRGDGRDEGLVILVIGDGQGVRTRRGGRPAFGIVDLFEVGDGVVDAVAVHLDDRVALLAVRLLDGFLHILLGVGVGDDVGEFEECRLHDGVDALGRAEFGDDVQTVEGVELDVLLRNLVLHLCGELLVHLVGGPDAVEQEGAAVFEVGEHIVAQHVRFVVARDEVRLVDEVGCADGLVGEAQVGHGQTAGLLGVIGEVALRVFFGVVADDFDAVLVRADGAVGAEAVELAGDGGRVGDVDFFFDFQRSARHVVGDADGEVVLLALVHILVDRRSHGRIEFLAAEAVSAAEHFRLDLLFVKRGDDVEIERFAEGTRFLGAVEHGDFLCGLGERGNELFHGEGTVKSDFEHADFLSFRVEVIDRLFDCFRTATHKDDDAVGVLCAVVVDEVILSARNGRDLVHHRLDDAGDGVVILVGGFSVLEVDVGVLRRARLMRMFGVE